MVCLSRAGTKYPTNLESRLVWKGMTSLLDQLKTFNRHTKWMNKNWRTGPPQIYPRQVSGGSRGLLQNRMLEQQIRSRQPMVATNLCKYSLHTKPNIVSLFGFQDSNHIYVNAIQYNNFVAICERPWHLAWHNMVFLITSWGNDKMHTGQASNGGQMKLLPS